MGLPLIDSRSWIGSCVGFVLALAASVAMADERLERPLLLRAEKVSGTLTQIDSDLSCHFRVGKGSVTARHSDLIRFGTWQPARRGPLLLLTDGSLLRADVLDLTSEKVKVGDASGVGRVPWNEATLSLSHIRAICFDLPAEDLARDRFLDRLAAGQPRDQVWLTDGETLAGVLLGWSGKDAKETEAAPAPAVQLKPAGAKNTLPLPLSKVRALTFGGSSGNTSPGVGKRLAIGCRDGSLIYASAVEVVDSDLLFKLSCGATLSLPFEIAGADTAESCWEQIELLQPLGGSAVYLSDLKPVSVKSVPFLTIEWPHQADRSVLGGWLRVGDKEAALKGLGQQAAGRLVYDVPAKCERFEAELAIDARAASRGSVQFRVLTEDPQGEWREGFRSDTIRGGEAATPISLPLKTAQRVALLVDFAERGDECDYANWLNARFLTRPD